MQLTIKIETTLTIKKETIQIFETEILRKIDHKNIPTIDHILTIIRINPVIILEKETTIIKTDQEAILNHHTKITPIFQTQKIETIEPVRQNIRD